MAQQTLAELVVQVREQGLAGLEATVEKFRPKLTQVENAAQNVQKALGSGFQQAASQAQTTISKLSAVTSQIQGNLHGVAASLKVANDNLKTVTPSVQNLSANVSHAGTELNQLEKELAEVTQQTTRTELASERLEREYRELRTTADRLRKEVDQLRQALDKQTAAASRASKAANAAKAGNVSAGASVVALTRNLVGLAAAYVSVTSLISAFQRRIMDIRALQQFSQQTGIAVDALSELKFAAEELDIPFDRVADGLTEFRTRLVDGIANPSSEAGQALRALGIEVRNTDGSIRDVGELLPEVAERFRQWKDGANEAAIAAKLFGQEAGIRMLPLLNQGQAGLQRYAAQARQLGVVVDHEASQAVLRMREAANRLTNALIGLANAFIEDLAPAIETFINAGSRGVTWFENLYEETKKFYNQFNNDILLRQAQDNWEQAMEAVRTARFDLNQIRDALRDAEAAFGSHSPEVEHLKEKYDQLAGVLDRAVQKQREMAMEVLRLQNIDWEPIVFRSTDTGAGTGQVQPPPMLGIAQEQNLAMQKAAQEAQDLMDRLLGQRMMLDELNFSWQAYQDAVLRAQELIRFSTESNFEAERQIHQLRLQMLQQQEQAAWDLAKGAAGALQQLFPKNKAFAYANAIINTAEAVTKALAAYPPPFNFGMAAAVAAAGAAQVAAIARTSATGAGSFPRIGSPPSATSTATSQQAAPPVRAINITMRKGDFWSSEAVAELISRINEEASNGRIVIATRTIPM